MRDGLPKLKDFPEELRRLGRGDRGVTDGAASRANMNIRSATLPKHHLPRPVSQERIPTSSVDPSSLGRGALTTKGDEHAYHSSSRHCCCDGGGDCAHFNGGHSGGGGSVSSLHRGAGNAAVLGAVAGVFGLIADAGGARATTSVITVMATAPYYAPPPRRTATTAARARTTATDRLNQAAVEAAFLPTEGAAARGAFSLRCSNGVNRPKTHPGVYRVAWMIRWGGFISR